MTYLGRLVFLNGIQEAKMEVVRKHNVSSEERVRSQMAMMDNRRKEAINEDVYELESDD